MSSVEATAHAAAVTVPAGLVQEVLRQTGVAVVFFGPDGWPVRQADSLGDAAGFSGDDPAPPAADHFGLAGLAREALSGNKDQSEIVDGCLRAAWVVRLRSRVVLAAAAEVPVAGPGAVELGRRLLAAVAGLVCARMEVAVLRKECEGASESLLHSFEEVSLLHQLGEVLRVNRPEQELLEYICGELRETVEAEATVAWLPEGDDRGPETIVSGRLPFPAANLPGIVGHLLESAGADAFVLVNNQCQEDPVLASLAPGMEQAVLVPLPVKDGLRGALLAVNRPDEEFGSPDAKLTRSTSSASAIFIENRRLYRELQELMLELIRALVSSVDAKDPYTCGHSERVATLARRIASRLRLPDEDIENVYLAGLLHDIGKIGTPEAILGKPGSLTDAERQVIKQHPEVGYRILAGIRKLELVREVVLHHHERLDGSGYPSGLKGEEIPLMARIVGLADAFDAMTSNRPYRPMLPLDVVKREIGKNIGSQFDAKAADALLALDLVQLTRELAARTPRVGATV